MKAVILVGGYGTRLKDLTEDKIPKAMVLIAGKPFLEHLILFLRDNGIKDIILAVHHRADHIKAHFGDGGWFNVNITYSEEDLPLGTAGAIKKAERYIDDTFLVLNGDSYSHLDLQKFIEAHKTQKGISTVALTKSQDKGNFGNVVVEGNKIVNFSEKAGGGDAINSGFYIFEPKIFDYIEKDKKVSLENEVFPRLVQEGQLFGNLYEGYFMDIGRPETYDLFKKDVLGTLLLRETDSVRKAMKKILQSRIDLILVVDERRKLVGVLNDKLIKNFLLDGGDINSPVEKAMVRDFTSARSTDSVEKISQLLATTTNRLPIVDEEGRVVDVEFRVEKMRAKEFPILHGKAPLRISFSGGGTDIPYFFEKHGGVVINATIDKYCHAMIVKRADNKIIIDSDVAPLAEVMIDSIDQIKYDGTLDLIKAVIKIMKPDFGFELYLHNDLAPGRGLGSSASLAVLITSLLNHLQGTGYDDYQIAEVAYKAEREELNIGGGWQDQYAAVTGGFNFMEFNKDKTLIYPLKLREEIINELNSKMLLCYVGGSHFSGKIHEAQEQSFQKSEEEIVKKLNELKKIAVEVKDCLLRKDISSIGDCLNESWKRKKIINPTTSNPSIDALYEVGLKNGAVGGRLLGAGGAGYILFFCSPKKRNQLIRELEKNGGEILNFNFETKGTQIWVSKN